MTLPTGHEAAAPAPSTRLLGGLSEIAAGYDLLLCDVWGVVHDGVRAHPPAVEALTRFRRGGGRVVLLTNAPRPRGPIEAQLAGFGAPRDCYDVVVTSGDVTLALMTGEHGAPVHHIGPPRDAALFEELAATGARVPPRVGIEDAAYVLVSGLRDDFTEAPDDYDPALRRMLARGMPMLCANPDLVVHKGARIHYCAGALAERYEAMGGRVVYAGKPHGPVYDLALREAADLGGAVARERVLAIGDALRTDVAGAHGQGFDALFVLGGIHREDFGEDGFDPCALAAILAPGGRAPLAAMRALSW